MKYDMQFYAHQTKILDGSAEIYDPQTKILEGRSNIREHSGTAVGN